MRTLKAIIQKTSNFVSIGFALAGNRPVRLSFPRDLTEAEVEMIVEVICSEVHDGRRERGECSCASPELGMSDSVKDVN